MIKSKKQKEFVEFKENQKSYRRGDKPSLGYTKIEKRGKEWRYYCYLQEVRVDTEHPYEVHHFQQKDGKLECLYSEEIIVDSQGRGESVYLVGTDNVSLDDYVGTIVTMNSMYGSRQKVMEGVLNPIVNWADLLPQSQRNYPLPSKETKSSNTTQPKLSETNVVPVPITQSAANKEPAPVTPLIEETPVQVEKIKESTMTNNTNIEPVKVPNTQPVVPKEQGKGKGKEATQQSQNVECVTLGPLDFGIAEITEKEIIEELIGQKIKGPDLKILQWYVENRQVFIDIYETPPVFWVYIQPHELFELLEEVEVYEEMIINSYSKFGHLFMGIEIHNYALHKLYLAIPGVYTTQEHECLKDLGLKGFHVLYHGTYPAMEIGYWVIELDC